MQKEDYNSIKALESILEKDLQKEMAKINTAGTINPTAIETLNEAVCLMLKLKEYEEWMNKEMMPESYYSRYPMRDPYMPYSRTPYWNSYDQGMMNGGYNTNPSNHSTKDRMISRLEDMMGDAKNEYEAKMIRDAIAYIQSN